MWLFQVCVRTLVVVHFFHVFPVLGFIILHWYWLSARFHGGKWVSRHNRGNMMHLWILSFRQSCLRYQLLCTYFLYKKNNKENQKKKTNIWCYIILWSYFWVEKLTSAGLYPVNTVPKAEWKILENYIMYNSSVEIAVVC